MSAKYNSPQKQENFLLEKLWAILLHSMLFAGIILLHSEKAFAQCLKSLPEKVDVFSFSAEIFKETDTYVG